MATKQTIAEAIGDLWEPDVQEMASHPSLEALLAYHASRLPSEEAEKLEEHFAHCRECGERSIELARFLAPEESLEKQQSAATTAPPPPPAIVLWFREPRHLQWLAAGLLVMAVVSSGAWVLASKRLVDGEINVPIAEISGFDRRATPGRVPAPQEVAPGAVLIFTPRSEPKEIGHEIRILDAVGHLVWSGQGLHSTRVGSFHLRLPRDLRPGSVYRIRIFASGQKPKDQEEIRIRITAPKPD